MPEPGPDPLADALRRRWLALFAINLILPGFLARFVVESWAGWVGVIAAVGVLATQGWWALGRSRRLLKPAWMGAVATALFQVVPVLQVGAGFAAIWAWTEARRSMGDPQPESSPGLVGGFALTLMVGLILIAVGLIFGMVLTCIDAIVVGPRAPADDAGPDLGVDAVGPRLKPKVSEMFSREPSTDDRR